MDTSAFAGTSTEASTLQADFFRDDKVNTVDHLLRKAIDLQLIHHHAEDDVLDGRTVRINGTELLNFASCSYLGLELDPRIKHAIMDSASRYGSGFIMSRTYASAPPYRELEELLSQIFEAYPVITPSTTLGHLSFMHVFVQQNDVLLLDQQVHNSVQMAVATVAHKAKVVTIKHNDLARLEAALQKYAADPGVNNIWYLCDGVYSMFADVAPVQDLIHLLDTYEKFYVYADDAHGMSMRGKHGRGYVLGEQEHLHDKMVVALSLSKCFAMGCGGVLVFPHAEWQRKVRTCGPTLIFSTPVPPPMLGAGIASAKIHLSGEIEELQHQLQERVQHFRQAAAALGVPVLSAPFTPIQYIQIGTFVAAMAVVRSVIDDGFLVNLCGYPAVPKRHCGLRLTLTRHVNHDDITRLAASIRRALEQEHSQ